MRLLATCVLVAALAGCATYNADGVEALNRGDLATAEQHFMEGVRRGDPMSINNLGVVYERRNEVQSAIYQYTLAARYGVPLAQQNLARLGQPVPAADLAVARAQQQAANAANAAAAAALIRATQPPPPVYSPSVNCTSYRTGNTVQTNCN